MPEEKTKRTNFVFLEGYMKENTLEKITTASGGEAIKGVVTIAISKDESYKVTYYIDKMTKAGKVKSEFEQMSKLLKENTMSIATYLKSTPTATWDVAKNQATKIYLIGRFEEYAVTSGGKEQSSATIRGVRGGLKTLEDRNPFQARATFEVDMYIESKELEEKDGEKTGRLLLTGLIPDYTGTVHRIGFVAEDPKVIAHIDANYFPTQTANFRGSLRCMRIENKEDEGAPEGWGSAVNANRETIFVRDRIITGGIGAPVNCDAEGAITREEIKQGLISRQEMVDKATKSRNKSRGYTSGNATPAATPAAEAPAGQAVKASTPASVGTTEFDFDSDEDF